MAFEIGKEYVFKQNDFEISRESGKLYFLVHDPASASSYKIKPFEFQAGDIPEKLVCTYLGGDKFEQTVGSVLPRIYKVGEAYKFRVMRQDNATWQLSLRDDLNGLNHFPIDLGRHKFKRFERINCRVTDIVGGRLKLEYVTEDSSDAPFFSLSDFAALPVAASLESRHVVGRLLKEAPFGEARMLLENKDNGWVMAALGVLDRNMPQWAGVKLKERLHWFDRLRSLVISLIEESPYLNLFPHGERSAMQERLSDIIRNCEDNLHAAQLVIEKREEQVITSTLSSLSRSGWLYNPEQKMRTMMAIFSFRPSIDDSYIGEAFRIIRDNHADSRFCELFRKGFIEMLNIYISNESSSLDPHNRPLLRKLAEAIAIELLLTANMDFNQWNNHRGLLYVVAAMLVRRADTPLVEKAIEAFAQRLDIPLEFAWRDLDDIMRLCHTRLSVPLPVSRNAMPDAVFEGEEARIAVSGSGIEVMPPSAVAGAKSAFSYPLFGDATFNVMPNARVAEKFPGDSLNLKEHHLFWNELEKTLLDTKLQPVPAVAAAVPVKAFPEIGAEVTIRITHRDETDEHLFHCVVEDDNYEGVGSLTTRDIVQYPVKAFADTFCHEGRQMLFKATVVSVDDDRNLQFSMRKQALAEALRIARNDRDSGDAIKAVITGETDKLFLGVTAGGYPVSVMRTPEMSFAKNAAVWVVVRRVKFDPEKETLYVSSQDDGAEEGGSPVDNYNFVKDSFQYLLQEMSDLRTYKPSADSSGSDNIRKGGGTESYISSREIAGLSQLLDGMAMIQQNDQARSYTLLAMARLMSVIAGDLYRAEYIAAKMSLVEKLATFAINGKLDRLQVEQLADRCSRIAPGDCDMAHKLDVLRALAVIDRPADESIALAAQTSRNDDSLNVLRRMVVSYNFMRGLGLNQLRSEMMERIFRHLNLPMPVIDTALVNEKEDQFNEFKESLFFPASNNMKPDEKKQVREIMEVTCGFLNSEGGTIYIGVNNQGVPKGLGNDFTYLNHGYADFDLQDARDKFNLSFCKGLRDHFGVTVQGVALYPSLVELEHEEIDGKPICRVVIKPFHGMVSLADGQVFVRQDSSTVPIKTKREQAAFDKKRAARFPASASKCGVNGTIRNFGA